MTGPTRTNFDPDMLRKAFSCWPSGVTAVCALVDGMPTGMAASSFTSISMDPPMVGVAMGRDSSTWPVLRDCPRLGISVLGSDHGSAARHLASKTGDRFEHLDWWAEEHGGVFIERSVAYFDCRLVHEYPAGDHTMVILQVVAFEGFPESTPLVFHRSRFPELVH